MGFKMKGPSLYPGYKKAAAVGGEELKVNRDYKGMSDGRATSSPFQMNEEGGKKKKKTKEDYLKEGFTPADADRMMRDGATTGRQDKPAKNQGDFEPAYAGADYSKEQIAKMTEKEKEMKIDGYTPKTKKKTKK